MQGTSLGARQVLFSITRPIEEAVSIVPGVTRVQSRSIRGGSETNVTFAPSTDMVVALQQVQARVNQVHGDLPPDLDIEVERMTPSLFPIISYNLEGGDPATLYDIARYQIKPLISRVPGVGRVDVQGSDVREIEVVADPARLAGAAADVRRRRRRRSGRRRPSTRGRAHAGELQAVPDRVGRRSALGRRHRERRRRAAACACATSRRSTSGTEDHVRIIAGDGKPAALLNITRQLGGNTLAIADSVAAHRRERCGRRCRRVCASSRCTIRPRSCATR